MPADRFGPVEPRHDPLDAQLDAARNDVLGSIAQPPLHDLRARATAHRARRRRNATVAVLAVALAGGGAIALRPQFGGAGGGIDGGVPIAAPSTAASERVYVGAGVTVIGLAREAPTSIPGRIGQVAFVNEAIGYVLNDCTGQDDCTRTLARTADGGRTWTASPVAADFEITELNAFAGGNVVLSGDGTSLVSTDSGETWSEVPDGEDSTQSLPDGDKMCRRERADGAFQTAALSTGGRSAALASQPDFDVRWVAPAATGGAWWAAGVTDAGRAAVAVTRDSGVDWDTTTFGTDGVNGISVAVLGADVHVLITGADGALQAVQHSSDGGATFHATRTPGSAGGPAGVAGEAVPLADGRLLIAGTDHHWYASADHGATFAVVEGDLPAVGSLRRTTAGYVADGLFGGGWAAFSPDGATWRKLWLN